jgi:hypothetical protein
MYSNGFSQDPYYTLIDKSAGLPSNTVYDIFQDSKGFMWFATDKGLVKYDGFEFKLFNNNGQSSKAGTNIKEDRKGRIWYQNFDGYVFYVQNDSLYALKQETPVGYFKYGLVKNNLFLIKKNGVAIYDVGSLQSTKSIALQTDKLSKTCSDDNDFYILDSNAITRISSDLKISKTPCSSLNSPFLSPQLLNAGVGLILFEGDGAKEQPAIALKNNNFVHLFKFSIKFIQNTAYADSCYWLCTKKGVYGYNSHNSPLNNGQAYFKSFSISYVFKDRENNFWFSTLDRGIFLVKNSGTKLFFEHLHPLKSCLVLNTLYVSGNHNKVYSIDLKTAREKEIYTSYLNQEITALFKDSVNNNMVLSNSYLEILNENAQTLFNRPGAIKAVRRVAGNYYAFALSGACALYKMDKDKKDEWTDFYNKNLNATSLAQFVLGCRARAVEYLPDKNSIYFGTSYGLQVVTPNGPKEIRHGSERIFAEQLSRYNNEIYGLTAKEELFKLVDNTITYLPFDCSEAGEFVYFIKVCRSTLFVVTNTGLYTCDLSKPGKLFALQHRINYDITDIELLNKKVILITNKGIIFDELQQPEIRSSMPLFRLNRIMVNNKLVVNAKPVILSHTQNNIELNYSILSFKTDFKFPLYYKINENDWKLTSPESRQLLLTALSPGKYTIAFRLGKTGTVMEPEDVVHFEITKPWWQTWWALVIFVSCFFCLFLIVYKWQTGILKKQNSLLQQKFELEKELRHSTLKSIKAQMNPHFFYNALNTIQNFIFSDDKRSASTYLSKFSKLTRTILEMSEKDTVGLIEELEALQLYLDIEKVRFTEDFNFSLIVPENINPEMIKIPSMLIQPYVENAIKHGLLHKKGAKELVVEFHLKDNFLYVRVDDNGIGRKRSAEINRIKNSKYESFATKANSKRLDILNKGDTKVGIEYTDKTDGMGNSLGTKVVIRIPVA